MESIEDILMINLSSLLVVLVSMILIDRYIRLVWGDDKDDKDDKKKK